MNSNCNDLVNDVVRIYPLPKGVFKFAAPANIKMASVNENFIEYSDNGILHAVNDEYLNSHPFFTIAETELLARDNASGCTAVTMEESPEVRITAKRNISGLIYSVVMNIVLVHPDLSENEFVEEMVSHPDYDYIVCAADDRRYLVRALDGSSDVARETNIKKDEELRLKISLQSLSSLTPIVHS